MNVEIYATGKETEKMARESVSKDHAGKSVSVWMATASVPTFARLGLNKYAEVCVIGAGISGLTTAYLLTRAGKSVVVLDDGPIASGETERSTAHLSNALDDRYIEIACLHGEKGARLAAESHTAAIDEIERIVREENIDCDFERVDGYLFAPPGKSAKLIEREFAAGKRAGLSGLEIIPRAPLSHFDTGPALRFPRQAQFHPLKYLAALAQAFVAHGGRIYTQTHASKIDSVDNTVRIETRDGSVVYAGAVVVATNTPVNDCLVIHTKQAAYRTFVIGVQVPAGSIHKALYWDTAEPYHYVRLQSSADGQDVLIIGGEDHRTGQEDDAEERYARLESWGRERFPMMTEVKFRWSGQVMEPIDGLAFIGRNPMDADNVYVATGDSGNGITHGTIAGMLLTDLINGSENPWAGLYDPSRVTLLAAKNYAKETINTAAQYADWCTPGDVEDDVLVAPGTGEVVRRGLTKIAVYCDEAGKLHECSAVCPHLEGIVAWNHSEQTWDCPCHGSRFDKFGKVLNGPANKNLAPVKRK